MNSMSRLLQDNFCGKNSWKSIQYSQSYDTMCQLALLGWVSLFLSFYTLTRVRFFLKACKHGMSYFVR